MVPESLANNRLGCKDLKEQTLQLIRLQGEVGARIQACDGRHDIQHDSHQHNDTRHNDPQHNNTQNNGTQHNSFSIMAPNMTLSLGTKTLSIKAFNKNTIGKMTLSIITLGIIKKMRHSAQHFTENHAVCSLR